MFLNVHKSKLLAQHKSKLNFPNCYCLILLAKPVTFKQLYISPFSDIIPNGYNLWNITFYHPIFWEAQSNPRNAYYMTIADFISKNSGHQSHNVSIFKFQLAENLFDFHFFSKSPISLYENPNAWNLK